MEATQRVLKLREHAMDKNVPGWRSEEGELLWYRGWLENHNAESNIIRRAKAKAYMLTNSTPVIDDGELLVGKPCYRELSQCEQEELKRYRDIISKAMLKTNGQGSHMAIDYEKLLAKGVSGIQNEIEGYRSELSLDNPSDMEKDQFYRACLLSLESVLKYAENYADYAEKSAERCVDETRKGELSDIARVCRKVPRYPAENFREALQSMHFVTFCLEGLYQFGRPDRYLIEYYRKDIQKGILTPEFAQELIDCLCILYNEYIQKGLAVGFMVGGRDGSGKDVTNELSYHFIESVGHTRMIYPSVGLCYTKDTPKDLLIRSCELLGEGLSHPALFNDDVITAGLRGYGLPPEEACLYINSTCVEITPIASSAVWVASPYINLVQLLLDIIGVKSSFEARDGIQSVDAVDDFDEFMALYRRRLGEKIKEEAIAQNITQMERYYHGGDPLVSCFVNDCLIRGKDIDQGGARYNWIMPSFVGLANLADSLMSIKTLVFDQKRLSLNEFAKILNNDYNDYQEFKVEILSRIPKYGNDDDKVDGFVNLITSWIVEEVSKYRTYRGDRFIPSLFCWVMHEHLGSMTLASPDGRIAGFPLGDGSGPAQGREKKGPTASILSSTKWDHSPFIGGIAVNMKFSKKMFKPESLDKMTALIETFMERGGFELQINVVDHDTLIKAREHPEEYGDLIGRVGGYSDYFIHLSPAMQEEVIMRTEHEI